MKCDARRRARAARCVRPRAACRLPSLAPALRHGSTSIGSRWECTPKPRTRRRSQARALRRPDESRPVRLDDRVVARLSRAVDCVRCAAVRACVVVVVARADARPARASARHRVRMRPFAPYALPAHGAPMHAFGARADRKRRASARRALTKPRRASARGPNRTRVRSPRYASSRLLTRGRSHSFTFYPHPHPRIAGRRVRSHASAAARSRRSSAASSVASPTTRGCARRPRTRRGVRASRRLAAPLPAAPIARLRARVRRRRFGSRPNIGVLYTARAVSNAVLIELIFNKER